MINKRFHSIYFLLGDIIGTVAIIELDVSPNGIFNTTATTSLRGGEWNLNGKKSFVINAKNADLFLVLAQTKVPDKCGDKVDAVTAFLIENDMNGIEIKESDVTLGCNGVQQSEVTFNNVELEKGKFIFNSLTTLLFRQRLCFLST